jgi:hypothetical protein
MKAKERIQLQYPKVAELVKNGYAISKALSKLNIERGTFYKCITPYQKQELIQFKGMFSMNGCTKNVSERKKPIQDHYHKFFLNMGISYDD